MLLVVRPFNEAPSVAVLQALEKSRESPFTTGFARLFPQIVRGSHEFSRINGFAPVLAIFRWAKLSNATVMGSVPIPGKIPTPEALLIAGSTIVPAKGLPPNQIRELDRANTDKCLSAITEALPAPQAGILTHEQLIWKQAALQFEPAADAGAAMQLLLDMSEYIENLARIAARDTPVGRALLTKIAKAKLESETEESGFTFLSKHCVAWEAKSDQADQQSEDIMKRRQKADDARAAVEEELRDFVKATMPAIGLWREFSTSYVPIPRRYRELEKQWPHYTEHAQDQQTDVAKNPPASE